MEEEISRVETIANKVIMDNRPVETKWISEEELSNFTLRKKVAVTQNIRLV
ncbi:hypothetical protein QGM71_20035 [Virgibacillus sp. C22-A2]|uniref:Uncharacterized protein n=1 Tax=Virgibacillus tibetensis TaxID=3042313 RepID=A0ABU6KMI9_9BACI|nr:hypothetical protein [Virgibacillus sp. C22-A2]